MPSFLNINRAIFLTHPGLPDFVEVIDETQASVDGVERSTKGVLRVSLSLSGAMFAKFLSKTFRTWVFEPSYESEDDTYWS